MKTGIIMDGLSSIVNDTLRIEKEMLSKHCKQLEKLVSSSKDLNELVLINSIKQNGKSYFYVRKKGEKGTRYVGDEKNELVQKLQHKRFLEESIKILNANVCAMEYLATKYSPCTFEKITESMPKAYSHNLVVSDALHEPNAENWLEKKLAIKERYPTKYPENQKTRAADGTLVRSKSEAIICDLLSRNDIPYVYECPTIIEGDAIYTDFTILSRKDFVTEVRIEHQGLIEMPEYRSSYQWKELRYIDSGFMPNRDIFFTFDEKDGGIDTQIIQRIIDAWLLP